MTKTELLTLITQAATQTTTHPEVTPDARLEDLGFDSLDLTELIMEVEARTDKTDLLESVDMLDWVTVQDLVDDVAKFITLED
jgi:acyl carrier protein